MKKTVLIIFSLFFLQTFAQQKQFSIKWENKKFSETEKQISPYKVALFQAKNYSYTDGKLSFISTWKDIGFVSSKSVKLSNLKTEVVSKHLIDFLHLKNIPTSFNAKLVSSKARQDIYTTLIINPIIKKGNQYFKLKFFEVSFSYDNRYQRRSIQNIYNSKLASGDWYKFEIDKTGVYKLDKAFLKSLGISVDNLNPKKIKIFGNGGAMLPLPNNIAYPEDITELAIEVVGESDGSFDDGDYVLFYGIGAEQWRPEYDSNLNIYSGKTYYFVQIDSNDGKRIVPYSAPTQPSTHTFDDYRVHKFYEKDEINVGQMGRKWVEKPFDLSTNTKAFQFKFDHINTNKQVNIRVRVVGDAYTSSSVSVKLNGQQIGNMIIPGVPPSGSSHVAMESGFVKNVNVNSGSLQFELKYSNNNNLEARDYLNYLNADAYCHLRGIDKQFIFYNPEEAAMTGVGTYHITGATGITRVWEITDPYNPTAIVNSNSTLDVKFEMGMRKKFIAIDKKDIFSPAKIDSPKVSNQNLHHDVFYHSGQFSDVDYLIITPEFLRAKADELADFHRNRGLKVYVANLDKIYNEFGNAVQDVAAIRNFVKYVYRNASEDNTRLKYLLLFGDASYDYRNLTDEVVLSNGKNTNIVPSYESLSSYSLVSSHVTDDYFGMMDDNEGNMGAPEKLDIAVGRLILRDETDAANMINKIKHYAAPESFKNWRTNMTFLTDDIDKTSDNFVVPSERIAQKIKQYHPEINLKKIYLDAYRQIQTPGGARYPAVERDLFSTLEKGTLILSYLGHGNESTLTHERVLKLEDVLRLKNFDRLPLITTLTCEFGRFDNPTRETVAENLLWNSQGGSLSLLTTVREITISYANIIDSVFYDTVFGMGNGMSGEIVKHPAEAIRLSKVSSSNAENNKISYLGDPALPLGFSDPKIVLTKINGKPADTLRSLQHIKMEGEVQDAGGNIINSFNGMLYPKIFDKFKQAMTLDNDGTMGHGYPFEKLGNLIFQGKAKVSNGKFSFEFIVPKDISLAYGTGHISFYGADMQKEYVGYNNDVIVGGVDINAEEDHTPPKIKAYMNDTNFVSGGITNDSPFLLLHLEDEHGINTSGGIGHDITAYLDDDQTNVFVLNDFYEADENTYKKGKLRYRLYDLEPGWHTLTIKAWDVYNNAAETKLDFQVVSSQEIKIDHVLNYPNPFVNYTEFWFNHNRPYENLDVMIQVYSVSGKLVWQHRQNVLTDSFLSREISWDGTDSFGNKLAKGVYIYKLSVRDLTGKTTHKIEKLVIL